MDNEANLQKKVCSSEKESSSDNRIMKNLHYVLTIISLIVAIFAAVPQIKTMFHVRTHNLGIAIPDLK